MNSGGVFSLPFIHSLSTNLKALAVYPLHIDHPRPAYRRTTTPLRNRCSSTNSTFNPTRSGEEPVSGADDRRADEHLKLVNKTSP